MADNGMEDIFPTKLYKILEYESNEIVQWSEDGTSFRVKDYELFQKFVLPKYFIDPLWSTFKQELNFYGFLKGEDTGVFHHNNFRRETIQEIRKMRRNSSTDDTSSLLMDKSFDLVGRNDYEGLKEELKLEIQLCNKRLKDAKQSNDLDEKLIRDIRIRKDDLRKEIDRIYHRIRRQKLKIGSDGKGQSTVECNESPNNQRTECNQQQLTETRKRLKTLQELSSNLVSSNLESNESLLDGNEDESCSVIPSSPSLHANESQTIHHAHANVSQTMTGKDIRAACRSGEFTSQTSGLAHGFAQANLCILPSQYAYDFLLFCVRNSKACPLIQVLDKGMYSMTSNQRDGQDIDIRTDLPKYRIYVNGKLQQEVTDIRDQWRDDFIVFVIGCSFTFEEALIKGGLSVRHIDMGLNVPMYRTNIPCQPAGMFQSSNMVVSMRPFPPKDIAKVVEITAKYPKVHGSPVHVGDPSLIGISDISKPDFGDAVTIHKDEVPLFWACGVTPQEAVMRSKPSICITHSPGHMLILDIPNDQLSN